MIIIQPMSMVVFVRVHLPAAYVISDISKQAQGFGII